MDAIVAKAQLVASDASAWDMYRNRVATLLFQKAQFDLISNPGVTLDGVANEIMETLLCRRPDPSARPEGGST